MKAIVIAVLAVLMTGCVYQPVQIDVYVPTAVELHDSNVTLDAHKDVNGTVAR
jgi:uncharacterized lipoprotein YbaY